MIRPTLAQMLRNPVYMQADLDVYEFFKSQGTMIVNDAADFTGMNGCYLYQGRDVKPDKLHNLKDQMLVLAPHEGIVPSEIWLTCRKKLMNNMKIQSARKATHTWLAGKIKCGNCGYALMSIVNRVGRQYLRCTKRLDNKSCVGCGKIYTAELETASQVPACARPVPLSSHSHRRAGHCMPLSGCSPAFQYRRPHEQIPLAGRRFSDWPLPLSFCLSASCGFPASSPSADRQRIADLTMEGTFNTVIATQCYFLFQ